MMNGYLCEGMGMFIPTPKSVKQNLRDLEDLDDQLPWAASAMERVMGIEPT